MSRTGQVFTAALLRPLNLLAPGAGLLLSLTYAPWWTFPLSLVPYGLMVGLSLRDPAFVQHAARAARDDEEEPIDWSAVRREAGSGPWLGPLERIAAAERNLDHEVDSASEGACAVLSSTLSQVRTAARLGVELARRIRELDSALQGYAGMDPDRSRREAEDKRRRAEVATDQEARKALSDASNALEESAKTADDLRVLRERTSAQLESLSVVLESVAVRGVRLRVQADGGPQDIAENLGAEVDAVRETLGVLESMARPARRLEAASAIGDHR
jgi:hypothetical protein